MGHITENLQKGDTDSKLELEILEDGVAVDLINSSIKTITIRRPDLTIVTKTATFTTNGSDGKIIFTTALSDLSMEGTYFIQAYLKLPTWDGYSTLEQFEVHDNLWLV